MVGLCDAKCRLSHDVANAYIIQVCLNKFGELLLLLRGSDHLWATNKVTACCERRTSLIPTHPDIIIIM